MKLTADQIAVLNHAMQKLESADSDVQAALPAGDVCYDLHTRIDELCADLEQILEQGRVPVVA